MAFLHSQQVSLSLYCKVFTLGVVVVVVVVNAAIAAAAGLDVDVDKGTRNE